MVPCLLATECLLLGWCAFVHKFNRCEPHCELLGFPSTVRMLISKPLCNMVQSAISFSRKPGSFSGTL
jgi:hypothetical protein